MSDGSKIYYEKSGQGFPLFLLHGNDGSGRFFFRTGSVLERYYTVYLVDSRGHGRSTNEASILNFHLMAEDLNTIMLLEKSIRQIFLDLVMAQIWHWYLPAAFLKKFID